MIEKIKRLLKKIDKSLMIILVVYLALNAIYCTVKQDYTRATYDMVLIMMIDYYRLRQKLTVTIRAADKFPRATDEGRGG